MTCDTCRDLVFDFVYGLLDEPEATTVREHLDTCPGCAAELNLAKTDQLKLGRAALAVLAVPEFTVPQEESPADPVVAAPASSEPVSAPGRRGPRVISVVAWAATLACCVVVAGVWMFQHRQELASQQSRVANLNRQHSDIEARLASLDQQFTKEQKQLTHRLDTGVVQLHVAGPGQVRPGVSAGFEVAIRDLDGVDKPGRVEVEFADAKNRILAKQSLDVAGTTEIPVPPQLKSAHGPVRMNVVASAAGRPVGRISETVTSIQPSFAAHLVVNKALFKPGDKALVRALVLDRVTLRPVDDGAVVTVSLADANGTAIVPNVSLTTLAGIGAGELSLPAQLPEGTYTVSAVGDRLTPVRRQIDVMPATAPPAELLTRNNRFRAGEPITQQYQLYNRDGKPAANAPVTVNANLSAAEPDRVGNDAANANGIQLQGRADAKGQYQLRLPAPKNESTGPQQLNIDLTYGDEPNRAQLSNTIVVAPSRVAVTFFPEGGRLVAGLKNRVFYRVHAADGTASASARFALVARGKTIFDTGAEKSLGSFEFVPDAATPYSLRILAPRPQTIADPFASLGIVSDGILLRGPTVQHSVAPTDPAKPAPLTVTLDNRGAERRVQLIATCRGEIVAHRLATVDHTPRIVELPVAVDGVIRVTALDVKDGHLTPLAERLFYRTPAHRLEINATLPSNVVTSPVTIRVTGRDERQQPIAFWSLVGVVDERFRGDAVEPNLPAHFLILGDADSAIDWSELPIVGLDAADPAAIDLTLGVIGWRQVGSAPAAAPGSAPTTPAPPELVAKGQGTDVAKGFTAGSLRGAKTTPANDATFFHRVVPTVFELRQTIEEEWKLAQLALVDATRQRRGELTRELVENERLAASARAQLEELSIRPRERLLAGLGVAALVLLVVAALVLILGLVRLLRRHPASGHFGIAFACLAGCLLLIVFRPNDETVVWGERTVAVAAVKNDASPENRVKAFVRTEKPLASRQANETIALAQRKATADRASAPAEAAGSEPRGRAMLGGGVANGAIARLDLNRANLARELEKRDGAAPSRVAADGTRRSVTLEQAKGRPAMADFGGGGAGMAKSMKLAPSMNADSMKAPPPVAPIGAAPPGAPAAMIAAPAAKANAEAGIPPLAPPLDLLIQKRTDALADREQQRLEVSQLRRQFAQRQSSDIADPTTLLWSPALFVPATGTSLVIDLPPQIARYRLFLMGHTSDGRLGAFDAILNAK